MAIGRLPSNVRIAGPDGLPTPEFLRAWNALLARVGGGAENPPSQPQNVIYSITIGGVLLSCDENPAAENITGYQWRLGTTWETGSMLSPLGSNSITIPSDQAGTYTVWVAAADVRGNFSEPASVSVTVTDADLGLYGPEVTLVTDGLAFVNLKNGSGLTPASILVTAITLNLPSGVYAWSVDGVLQVGEVNPTFSLAAFAAGSSKVVRCDVTSGALTAYDVFTIYSVNEGDDAYTAGLSNENQSILVNAAGTAVSGLPAGGAMTVARGATVLSSGVVYSKVSQTGCTASINSSTGVYTVTAISADTASVTFRATVTTPGVVIDKIMSLNKSYPGATGTTGAAGPRGSLKGYGSQYGIVSTSWSDQKANRVINNMLTGGVLTTNLATTTHLVLGDTVQLTNGSSYVESRFWSGSAWIAVGTVIEGNILVNGTGVFTGDLAVGGSAAIDGVTSNTYGNTGLVVNSSLNSMNGVVAYAGALVGPYTDNPAVLGIQTSTVFGELGGVSSGVKGSATNVGLGASAFSGVLGETSVGTGVTGTATGSGGVAVVANASGSATVGLYLQGGQLKVTSSNFATGAATATVPLNNKPGSSVATANEWVECYKGTTRGWIPWVPHT